MSTIHRRDKWSTENRRPPSTQRRCLDKKKHQRERETTTTETKFERGNRPIRKRKGQTKERKRDQENDREKELFSFYFGSSSFSFCSSFLLFLLCFFFYYGALLDFVATENGTADRTRPYNPTGLFGGFRKEKKVRIPRGKEEIKQHPTPFHRQRSDVTRRSNHAGKKGCDRRSSSSSSSSCFPFFFIPFFFTTGRLLASAFFFPFSFYWIRLDPGPFSADLVTLSLGFYGRFRRRSSDDTLKRNATYSGLVFLGVTGFYRVFSRFFFSFSEVQGYGVTYGRWC